jgi:hypothetical protein
VVRVGAVPNGTRDCSPGLPSLPCRSFTSRRGTAGARLLLQVLKPYGASREILPGFARLPGRERPGLRLLPPPSETTRYLLPQLTGDVISVAASLS